MIPLVIEFGRSVRINEYGWVAECLCRGLQRHVCWFKSNPSLHYDYCLHALLTYYSLSILKNMELYF